MDDSTTIELDITGNDAMTWVESHHCTAEATTAQSCPGGTSYRVTGTTENVRQLLAEGGYGDGEYTVLYPPPASQTSSPATWPYGPRD